MVTVWPSVNIKYPAPFVQLVSEPTTQHSLLDIVLSNEPMIVSDVSVEAPVSNSDHCQVNFCVTVATSAGMYATEQVVKQYLWDKADYDGLSFCLSAIDWPSLIPVNLTTNQLWSAFCAQIDAAIEQYVPYVYVSTQRKQHNKKSYPRKIKSAIARKRCLWPSCRISPLNNDLIEKYDRAADKSSSSSS